MKQITISVLFAVFLSYSVSFSQSNVFDSLSHNDMQRQYALHIPPQYSENNSLPLIIFLHGGGGNIISAMGFTGFNQISNSHGFLVGYPQGGFEIEAGSFVWADGRGTAADKAGIDDTGFIDKFTDKMLAEFNIDPKKVYLCGFSNGSFLTQRIAFESNSRYAAMATLGATLDSNMLTGNPPDRAVPMMYLFGTDDPLVPAEGGQVSVSKGVPVTGIESAVQYWVEHNNCKTELDSTRLPDIVKEEKSVVTVFEYTDCDCNSDVKFYKVYGAGHTWPGIEIKNYEQIAGETNEDIHAGYELWNFFRQYELCMPSGIPENRLNLSILLYPNPASEAITISLSNKGLQPLVQDMRIYNSLGEKVYQQSIKNSSIQIDISDFPEGVYFVKYGDMFQKFMVMR